MAALLDLPAHELSERGLVEGDLGKEQDVRRLVGTRLREPDRRGDPAGVTPHHLEHEDLRGGLRHGGHVDARLVQERGRLNGALARTDDGYAATRK